MVIIAAAPRTSARSGTLMALGSMSCVQLGLALSLHLFGAVGPLGVVWLRLAWAAVILLVAIRPRPWRFRRPVLLATVALGIASAGVTMLFMTAVARLPLGTASALEFLGPLGVAVARRRGARRSAGPPTSCSPRRSGTRWQACKAWPCPSRLRRWRRLWCPGRPSSET